MGVQVTDTCAGIVCFAAAHDQGRAGEFVLLDQMVMDLLQLAPCAERHFRKFSDMAQMNNQKSLTGILRVEVVQRNFPVFTPQNDRLIMIVSLLFAIRRGAFPFTLNLLQHLLVLRRRSIAGINDFSLWHNPPISPPEFL